MMSKVKTVLVRWRKSIKCCNNLDKWSLNEDFNNLSSFIRTTKDKALKVAISTCRDLAVKNDRDNTSLARAIDYALKTIAGCTKDICSCADDACRPGQRERYNDITMSIGKEKIRCCRSKYLRNLDITILEPKESRIVRRIVEKRMCQEYHRQHKDNFHSSGNKSRHQMKRAVSYQLYNIGQMEGEDIHRDGSTHWKWKYDSNIKEWVLKKKVAYRTEEEAMAAAVDYMARNPQEGEMSVYRCNYCNMYHIGHTSRYEQIAG